MKSQSQYQGKSGLVRVAETEAKRLQRKTAKASARAAARIVKRFAVMRVKKYKAMGSIANLSKHNLRNGDKLPRNADPSRQDHNRFFLRKGCTTLDEAVKARLEEAGITPRQNAVRMLEFVCTYSKESPPKDLTKWANDTLTWAKEVFGKKNLIGAELHMDEATPHIHLQVVPIVSKRRKMRNKDAFHEAQERLDARTLIGGKDGPKKLSNLQTSYADAMKAHGLERGIMKSGSHHPNHKDVRILRGEIIKKKGIIYLQDRLDKLEGKRLKAESDALIAQSRYAGMYRSYRDKDAELERERKRFKDEIDRQERLRLEAVKQRDELQKRLIQLHSELATDRTSPALKMNAGPRAKSMGGK